MLNFPKEQIAKLMYTNPKEKRRHQEGFASVQHDYDQFMLILAGIGWPPPLRLDVWTMREWVGRYANKDLTDIDHHLTDLLETLYDESILNGMLDIWRSHPRLANRMHIIESAFKAHIGKQYDLSVPVLLAQTEGFVASVNNVSGQLFTERYKQYLFESASNNGRIAELVRNFITGYLLKKFNHGDVVPNMSRHAILHGADLKYGTAANSLKAILFLDWLQSKLK